MARASHEFGVLDPPERVWAAISDFSRWNRYLKIPDARKRGWGDSFAVRAGSGQGMDLAMLCDGDIVQDWIVEVWEPPQRLRLASRACYTHPMKAMASSIDFTLASVSAAETRVSIVLETSFTDPTYGWFLNLVPMRGELAKALERMSAGILDVLQGA
jgi:hypothetical protein